MNEIRHQVGDERLFTEMIIYTDGASRGNPGPAGAGWVLTAPDGTTIEEGTLPLGRTTNNVAEYRAVIAALERAREAGARRVTLRSDSELLVRQLSGSYRVRSEGLLPLYEQARSLVRKFEQVRFEHVPREANRRADALANQAVDGDGRADKPRSMASSRDDAQDAVTVPVRLRVRYGETDQMGLAYYANYLDWFTEGRTELMRRRGVPYRELEAQGIFLPVREAHCTYLRPARYDDVLEVHTEVQRLTPARLEFSYRIERVESAHGEETGTLAEGWTKHAFVDASGRPFSLSKRHPDLWARVQRAAEA